MRTELREPAALQRRGPGGLARRRSRRARGDYRLGAGRWPNGLKGERGGEAAGRPERLLSSDRMRAAAAGRPGERAGRKGGEQGEKRLAWSAPRARASLLDPAALPDPVAAWRANVASSGCVRKGVPKAQDARWQRRGAERQGRLRACTTGARGVRRASMRGSRVHTALTRAWAGQQHARSTPLSSLETAPGVQVKMMPSKKKTKFVSKPRQGTEQDLERAERAASRIELFMATKAGGSGLSQGNSRSGNKTLQCMLAALAKMEQIDVDDPRPTAMKRSRGGNEYQGHLFSVTKEHAAKLLGNETSIERALTHDAHFFDGKEDTIKKDQSAVVIIAKYEEIHLVTLPGAPAGSFAPPDDRDVLVGVRVKIASAILMHFADSAEVRALLSEALEWSLGENMLGQLAEEGVPGWAISVTGARTAEEITGAAGHETKMRHGAIFDVRLRFEGDLARMDESHVGLPMHVGLPTTVKVDAATFVVDLPDQEEEAGSWGNVEVAWTGPPVRETRLVQVTDQGSSPSGPTPETRSYLALGGEEGATFLASSINDNPGNGSAVQLDRWERGPRSSGGERRKSSSERRGALIAEVARSLEEGMAAAVGAGLTTCPTAARSLATEAVATQSGRRAITWAAGVVERADASSRTDVRWNPGQEWAQHVCDPAAGAGCRRMSEPCASIWQVADARAQLQQAEAYGAIVPGAGGYYELGGSGGGGHGYGGGCSGSLDGGYVGGGVGGGQSGAPAAQLNLGGALAAVADVRQPRGPQQPQRPEQGPCEESGAASAPAAAAAAAAGAEAESVAGEVTAGRLTIGRFGRRGRTEPLLGVVDVSIDRRSAVGNPYPMGARGKDESLRQSVCAACDEWLEDPEQADVGGIATRYGLAVDPRFRGPGAGAAAAQELRRIEGLLRQGQNVRLICWCFPMLCHGDGIGAIMAQRIGRGVFERPVTHPLPDELPRCGCDKDCKQPVFPSDVDGLCDFCAEGYPCQCAGERVGPDDLICCPDVSGEAARAGAQCHPCGPAGGDGALSGAEAMETEPLAPSSPPSRPSAPSPQPQASPKRPAEGGEGDERTASRPRPSSQPIGPSGRGGTVRAAGGGAHMGEEGWCGAWAGGGGPTLPERMTGDAAAADPRAHGRGDARPAAPPRVGGGVPTHRREAGGGAGQGAELGQDQADERGRAGDGVRAARVRPVGREPRRGGGEPEVAGVGATVRGHDGARRRARRRDGCCRRRGHGGVDSGAAAAPRLQQGGDGLQRPPLPHPAPGPAYRVRPDGRERERVSAGWSAALRRRAAPVGRVDAEELARRKFLRRVEDGIEPHPGPRGNGSGQVGEGAQGEGRGEGGGAGAGRRATVRTASVRHLVGCTFGHKSGKTVPVGGGGSNRRAYICGKCRQNFVQDDPAKEGYVYSERRPVEKKEGRRSKRQNIECPPERGAPTTDARTRCLGDFTIRFHNSGGLACPEMRRRYLRKMMRGVDVLGICETSWESTREEDARTVAAWDPKIKADLYVAGQYQRVSGSARNAGLALLVRRGAEVKGARVRQHGDQTLQCMIVDLTIRGEEVRVVLTHGDPGSVLSAKEAVYRRVERAIRRVQAEDEREGVTARRRAIWMGDHNMVKDRVLDEDRGTVGSLAAHQRLVAALESAEACLSDEGHMVDGYVATHERGSRGYTHGVRRIDRAAVSPTLLERGCVPRVEGVEHVAQDRLEVAMRTARGWELKTPHHKAVDVTLRFSDEPRARGSTWVAKGREAYPPRVWEEAMGAMRKEVSRRVRVTLGARGGGVVAVTLARTAPAERQEGWEVAVRGVLEGYEKADRKQVCKQIGGLRTDRERLRRAMEGAREGSARHKGLAACLQRRDGQIQALKIRMGMTEEERARRGLWSLGKDQRVTHEVLGGGG